MFDRAESLVHKLSKHSFQYNEIYQLPDMPSIRMVRVIRNGVRRRLFTNLLAKGDVIELTLGEQAPADALLITDQTATDNQEPFILKGQACFMPSNETISGHAVQTYYAFELLSTPFSNTLDDMLATERPKSSFENELSRLRWIWQRATCFVFGLTIIVVTLRFILMDIVEVKRHDRVFEAYIQVVYVLMPMLPSGIITLLHVCRLCATARLITLFELLQASDSAFEEREEVDEFDQEAPPPTKEVHVKFVSLLRKMFSLLRGKEQRYLTRSVDIIASLGRMTNVCALDREGTLCASVPTLNQLLVPNADDDMVMLDVEEDAINVHFEDASWQDYISTLKPLGLNFALNSNCWHGLQLAPLLGAHFQMKLNTDSAPLPPLIRSMARQACLCRAATEIGFTPMAIEKFKRRGTIYVGWDQTSDVALAITEPNSEQPSLTASLYEETENGTFQLLSEGDPGILLTCCADYWDGQCLAPISEDMLRKLMDFQQTAIMNDLACIAFAYRPMQSTDLTPDDLNKITALSNNDPSAPLSTISPSSTLYTTLGSPNNPEKHSSSASNLLDKQIFLGYATLSLQPKADVREFIEDLGMSGIRFVYFSKLREQPSKAFGDRVGLDTDWNSCIILSSYEEGMANSQGYSEQHDIKARLPRGVQQIRHHLEHVDDIPLHVSLFAECSPESNIGMIETFQQYGEVICAMGSVLDDLNDLQFASANIAIGIEPLPRHVHQRDTSYSRDDKTEHQGRVSALAVSTMLNRLACSFTMKHDTSLYVLNQLIGEARQFLSAFRQAIAFFALCSVSLCSILFISACMVLPQALSAGETIWTITIILPVLAFSLINAPQDPDIMKLMPGKNAEHLRVWWPTAMAYGTRIILPTGMCIVVFVLSLASCLKASATTAFVFEDHQLWYDLGEREQQAIRYARQCCIFAYVYFMGNLVIGGFQHRTLSMWTLQPFRNVHWLITIFVVIIAQGIYTYVTMSATPPSGATDSYSFLDLPWYIYFMVFAWPIVFMPVQELVKWRECVHYTQLQKRRKLEFNTKLGMHSPV
ncbi:hypothetical protein BDF19DRAFT_439502 [Syncephalis fuscata]|nr:hypothetical protein BDF19DRAFT_439502 [Syncephalis fuscata]